MEADAYVRAIIPWYRLDRFHYLIIIPGTRTIIGPKTATIDDVRDERDRLIIARSLMQFDLWDLGHNNFIIEMDIALNEQHEKLLLEELEEEARYYERAGYVRVHRIPPKN